MAVSYEQARELVREALELGWTHGTFCLDDRYIIENDQFYVFNVGAREYIVDGDEHYVTLGGVAVVSKEDGRIGPVCSPDVAMDPTIVSRPNPSPTVEPYLSTQEQVIDSAEARRIAMSHVAGVADDPGSLLLEEYEDAYVARCKPGDEREEDRIPAGQGCIVITKTDGTVYGRPYGGPETILFWRQDRADGRI